MKKYRRDRNYTLLMMVVVLIAIIVKNMFLIHNDNRLYGGIVLLVLIAATFIGLGVPLFSPRGYMEFVGWILGAFVLLLILAVLVVIQMITGMYPQAFYGYVYDAIAFIAICLALWQNHCEFVRLNRDRRRSGRNSAVAWTGLSIAAVQGFMISYKDKKKKK